MNPLLALGILIAIGASGQTAYRDSIPEEERLWRFGTLLLEEGNHSEAAEEFRRLRAYYPDSPRTPWATLLRGVSLMQAREFESARREFQALSGADGPEFMRVRARLEEAKSFHFSEDPEEAEKIWLAILEDKTHLDREVAAETVFYLGWNYLERGEGKGAAHLFAAIPDGTQFTPARADLVEQAERYDDRRTKSPVVAGVLSAVLPGAGHAYVGRWRDAVVSLTLNGLFLLGAYEAFRHELYLVGGATAFFELTWYGGNIFGAVNHAHQYNVDQMKLLREKMPFQPGDEKLLVPK